MYIAIGIAAFFALMFLAANLLKDHEACNPEEEWDGTTDVEVHWDNGTERKSWYGDKNG